ncbi:MAG: stage III sporulation protein AE [Oscillospiraceae bacterium]|jgi:stage III sporulation protein AE|nr:stage III sporulation protein AE [Oscillospiraceae bacterium]
MRKAVFMLIMCCALAWLTALTALCADVGESQARALKLDKLEESAPPAAGEALGKMSVMDSLKPEGHIEKLLAAASSSLREIASQSLKSVTALIAAAALCGAAGAAFGDHGSKYAELAAVLAVSAVSVGGVRSFIGMGAKTLDDLDAFAKILIPTLTAAAAGGGAVASSAAKYAATMMFVNISVSLSKNVVMPLIYAYTAVSVADAAVGGGALRGVAELSRWLAKTVMTVSTLAFVAYLTLVGAASGPGDELAMRAAKTAISALPVVGGIAADAASAVVSGAAMLRNAIGIFGALTVAGICVLPFLRLGVHYLLFKAAGGLSGAFAGGRVSGLIVDIGAAFGMTLGMTGAAAVMIFISIISMTKAVV